MGLRRAATRSREVSFKWPLLFGTLPLVLAALLCYQIDEPFDFNDAVMSTGARNHLRYGFGTTKFALVVDSGPRTPEHFTYYTNHPPLVPVLVSLSFALFGQHEWAARLVPIACSVSSLILIFILGARLKGPLSGLLGGMFFGLFPMTLYPTIAPTHADGPLRGGTLADRLCHHRPHNNANDLRTAPVRAGPDARPRALVESAYGAR